MENILNRYKQKFGANFNTVGLAEFLTINELKEILQCAIEEGKPVNPEVEDGMEGAES